MTIVISFFISFFVTFLLQKYPNFHFALDEPNARSLHHKVTPRTGGVGVMLAILAIWLSSQMSLIWGLLLAVLAMVSLLDDMYGLAVYIRFLTHLMVAILFTFLCLNLTSLYMQIAIILLIVWMINLYNFMDGADGLAGGMAVIGFTAFAIAAYCSDDVVLALASSSIASAALAFLCFNFYPSKIFMGDTGSIAFGFLAASIGVYGYQHLVWKWWFPMLVFSPFIVDASVTLFKRAIRREKLWQAHREHYYQRLVQMGWGHKKTALAEYALMAFFSILALFILRASDITVTIFIGLSLVIFFTLMRLIDQKWLDFSSRVNSEMNIIK